MGSSVNMSFLKGKSPLWNKCTMEKLLSVLEKIKNKNEEESKERCFTEFFLEIEQAYRIFLRKINDLPMIMNCRVKGDNKSHFGGQECAELMRAIRISSEKYLKETAYKNTKPDSPVNNYFSDLEEQRESTLYNLACKLKELAREQEQDALNIEAKVYQDYVSLGKDNTLEQLITAGYSF